MKLYQLGLVMVGLGLAVGLESGCLFLRAEDKVLSDRHKENCEFNRESSSEEKYAWRCQWINRGCLALICVGCVMLLAYFLE